jgi:leader peptidase (prepilin peptidase) / N-methyltransferase
VGSFLNVVSLRFNPEEDRLWKNVGGRSRCSSCGHTLSWYELIPLLSFIFQKGRCRHCSAKLTWQYPIVELLSGAIFVLVPYTLWPGHTFLNVPYVLIVFWVLAFLTLLLMSVIDLHHRIIPDSLNFFITFLGLALIGYRYFIGDFSVLSDYGSGSYSLLFPFAESFPLNHLLGALFGFLSLGALYFISKGRGMGLGDVKLALALGIFVGWPDIVLGLALAFITGSVISVGLIAAKLKTMKDYLPFGPFIALGVAITFSLGETLIRLYFNFFSRIFPG